MGVDDSGPEHKKNPPARRGTCAGGGNAKPLRLPLLGGRRSLRGLRSLGLGHALLEFVHATGRIHEFLLTGVKGVADVANTDQNRGSGGAGLDDIAAGATDLRVLVFRMNVSF